MLKTTALHAEHQSLGARLVDFAGWDMPIQYRSQLEEHHAVRAQAGVFDVSHMRAVEVYGARAREFLLKLLANDVSRIQARGKALYTCMLREDGGVIDDLIVYGLADDVYRLVVNAGTTDKDLAWLGQQAAPFKVEIRPRPDLGILAVQGPKARELTLSVLNPMLREPAGALAPFTATWGGRGFIARTGYTGEDGFEIMLPHVDLVGLWKELLKAGVTPCGLGARDTLRLEAGMNLYGQDMDESVTPLECGLGWTVTWTEGRDFIGRAALEQQRATAHRQQIGLVLEGRGVLRAHMPLRFANGAFGEISSGGFAPTMKQSIALARVDAGAEGACEVEIRGAWLPARVAKPPFVRHGKVLV
jgi:aminomethyltransferase